MAMKVRNPETLGRDAADLYRRHYGDTPAGLWFSPGRVNLIGDHVDYAFGLCLPVATTMGTAVAASPRSDSRVRMISVDPTGHRWVGEADLRDLSGVSDWRGYIAGTLWALDTPGMDLAVVSDVPLGSGLSSSAALECAVAVAARDLYNLDADLAAAAMRAENEVVGANTGGLDQRACLYSRPDHALALDFLDGSMEHVPCDLSFLSFLVANTNAAHSHATRGYGSRRGLIDALLADLSCTFREESMVEEAVKWAESTGRDPEVVRRRVRHVVSETQRTRRAIAALRAGDAERFGALMNASHDSLRDDYEVVTPELEAAVRAAREAGAVGARMTGGGFGGSIVALSPDTEEATRRIKEAVPRADVYVMSPQGGAKAL
ncbi:galactokinase [Corynebacterium sp. 21KM1197]|uniref:galactokinase n=1 Tax=Corynebacterium sp. 21KM1197 TaxID=2989734 RepID=UPI0029CA5B9A|nr:galactokinase [Corynebacterium sp. 21KM1197]WPF69609.1 galactokinase [Corynebacterium sp. 21KM1197]